ncbi:MAG TPA: hypothetical protein VHG32_00665 [Thermoanaerobaculia bacterium]|nr:hypothetical protein [Thermoanaerobaculia bacterium]
MDLEGRLRNTKVAAQDAFLPLFEAVINSIHSTEDRFGDDVGAKGCVEIHVHRVPQLPMPGAVGRPPIELIQSLTVVDNGLGFTDANLSSFETADSTAKLAKGGKGIGRLTWLVVFQRAEVESTFVNAEGHLRHRSFTFSPSATGISDYQDREVVVGGQATVETRIRLLGVSDAYAEPLRKGLDVIAEKVFEHCFNYFVLSRCPRVTLIDQQADGTSSVQLNDRVAELDISEPESLRVGEHELHLRHVRQRYAVGRRHLGHLLANDRVVSSFHLSEVSDLGSEPIKSPTGEHQVHHVFVGGAALDAAADSTRTHFTLPDAERLIEVTGLLDLTTLREAVGAKVNDRLSELLRAEREENLQRIQRHIRTVQPEYARLLEKKADQLSRVRWSDNPRQLDEAIYRVKQTWELEIRQQQSEVEQKLVEERTDLDEIADQLYKVISETNLAGQDDLVRYVVKRRAVLKLLNKMVSRFDPALEEHIHRIVFPLRTTNGEVDYEDHNLWLVDDTLSFYEYVASDLQLKKNVAAPSDSRQRPDILAFKTGDPFQHVSIVEFKKPDREDVENPVEQLVRYANLLRKGGGVAANGVTLPGISLNVRIDAYAIVTLDPKMEELLQAGPGEMKRVESEWRWYGAVSFVNMNVEVLDFRAFISRAEQRNRAFFRTLQLP